MKFQPAVHQRWWEDNYTTKIGQLADWLGNSDRSSRQAIFDFADTNRFGSVLEIGPGLFMDYDLHWSKRPFSQYEVVDVTPAIVKEAKQRGIAAHLGPIERLPYSERSVDFVYCRHVWEHCPNFTDPLREMLRVARTSAAVVLFRHKEIGETDVSFDEYDGLDNVYHNTYSRSAIAEYAKSLGWNTRWESGQRDAIGFFTNNEN